MSVKTIKRLRRHKKIRARMHGTKECPRLCVFRSNQHIYAQLINDDDAKVLISVSDKDVKAKKGEKKLDVSKDVGKMIAKKAMDEKIEKAIFDRGGFLFHGRIKAVAEGAREQGLKF
ncbi:MAG: 50S ribosomal protein L18 [Candidatus Staskawiczbacteria bacterium]